METSLLANGFRLHSIKTNKFKTLTLCLCFRRSLSKDEATKNACIPAILKRGSAKYPNLKELSRKIDGMYGASFDAFIVKKGEEQICYFYLDILDRDERLLDDGLEFLCEIALNTLTEPIGDKMSFNQNYVESEKNNIAKAINDRINSKAEYVKLKCLEHMCAGEPFGIYGDGYTEDIPLMNAKNLYEQYKLIINESPVEFFVIGNVKESLSNKVKERIADKLGTDRNLTTPGIPEIVYHKKEPTFISEKMDITQGKLAMGFRSNAKQTGDSFARLLVFNEILGGSANSLLFKNVREKESLCYGIGSFIFRFKSILFIQSGVDFDQLNMVMELSMKQIENIAGRKISKDDLTNAKTGLAKKLDAIKDYPGSIADYYLSQIMLLDNSNIEDAAERINKVEMDEVAEIASGIYLDTVMTLTNN